MRKLERIKSFLDTVFYYMTVDKEPNLGVFYKKVADGKDLFYLEEDSFEYSMEDYDAEHRAGEEITMEEYKALKKFFTDFRFLWYRVPDWRFCQCMVNIERFVTGPLEKASNQQIIDGFKELTKDVKMPLYILTTYHALPCEAETFIVNGIPAFTSDFGTTDSRGDGEYGCEYHKFIPYKEPKKEALEEYHINEEEYEQICEALECKLYVEHCGWCS